MMDDEQLLTQCLQVLEDSIDVVRSDYENDWRQGVPTRAAQLKLMHDAVVLHEETIKALKRRLGK